jgi:geranylgeranyl pyrophosphate synthase
VKVQTAHVFQTMHADLNLVEARLTAAARIDFPGVSALVQDLVKAGGKRLRPLVLLLAGRAYTADIDNLVTAAAGVELLHTASLVHDDNIDRAALRRGRPTLNASLSSGAVILIGDFLFAQSAILAAATQSPRVVGIFASSLGDICDGQLREMIDSHRIEQSREEYERRIYGKTAALFAGAAEMGAVLGGAPESDIAALRGYGADLGMAFQIMDDVLDLREETVGLGKPAGNDLLQGTVTLPTMFYAQTLDPDGEDMALLKQIVTGESEAPEEIAAVVASIRASGAIDAAVEVAEGFVASAKQRLAVVPEIATVEMLAEVADIATHRSF